MLGRAATLGSWRTLTAGDAKQCQLLLDRHPSCAQLCKVRTEAPQLARHRFQWRLGLAKVMTDGVTETERRSWDDLPSASSNVRLGLVPPSGNVALDLWAILMPMATMMKTTMKSLETDVVMGGGLKPAKPHAGRRRGRRGRVPVVPKPCAAVQPYSKPDQTRVAYRLLRTEYRRTAETGAYK